MVGLGRVVSRGWGMLAGVPPYRALPPLCWSEHGGGGTEAVTENSVPPSRLRTCLRSRGPCGRVSPTRVFGGFRVVGGGGSLGLPGSPALVRWGRQGGDPFGEISPKGGGVPGRGPRAIGVARQRPG